MGHGAIGFLIVLVPSPDKPRYAHLLALTLWAGLLLSAGDLAAVAMGWRAEAGPLLGPPGLAWLDTGETDLILLALLRMVNVLTLWYLIALGAGLRVLFGCAAPCSLLFAATGWALSVLANLWVLRLMRDLLHLSL